MTPIQSSILDALLRHGKSNEIDLRHFTGNSALTMGIALRQLQSRNLVQLSGRREFELSESGVAAMTRESAIMTYPARTPSGDSRQHTVRALE
jgi:hypothetical protein